MPPSLLVGQYTFAGATECFSARRQPLQSRIQHSLSLAGHERIRDRWTYFITCHERRIIPMNCGLLALSVHTPIYVDTRIATAKFQTHSQPKELACARRKDSKRNVLFTAMHCPTSFGAGTPAPYDRSGRFRHYSHGNCSAQRRVRQKASTTTVGPHAYPRQGPSDRQVRVNGQWTSPPQRRSNIFAESGVPGAHANVGSIRHARLILCAC